MQDNSKVYSSDFFVEQQDGSIAAAEVIVPIMLDNFKCQSVVDIGCGVGGWLNVFRRRGVKNILGVDGDYVDRSLLQIPENMFRSADLACGQQVGDFDVACSLEVAEHLPEYSADAFVATLVGAAPVVLFSAAIKDQGGTNHINEQPQSYWWKKFADHGFVGVDLIRPLIYQDHSVPFWYRQNIVVYCRPQLVPTDAKPVESQYEIDRIYPEMLVNVAARAAIPKSGKRALRMIRRAVPVLVGSVLRGKRKVDHK